MKKNALAVALVAVLFAGIGLYVGTRHAPSPNPTVNALLSQSLPDVQGTEQSLAKWKGKPLIVNFWAPWCAPCVEEMPELSALQAKIAAEGIQVIGIGVDSQASIAAFAAQHHISYPLYVAGISATELSRQLGNKAGGLPFTLLVGADGSVKKTWLGRINMDELRQDLPLLQSKV
jgi:thiol-disulfide isomerase/thioredoxin